jgi:hypothetical protein
LSLYLGSGAGRGIGIFRLDTRKSQFIIHMRICNEAAMRE